MSKNNNQTIINEDERFETVTIGEVDFRFDKEDQEVGIFDHKNPYEPWSYLPASDIVATRDYLTTLIDKMAADTAAKDNPQPLDNK